MLDWILYSDSCFQFSNFVAEGGLAEVICDFRAGKSGQLKLEKGDFVKVIRTEKDGWLAIFLFISHKTFEIAHCKSSSCSSVLFLKTNTVK